MGGAASARGVLTTANYAARAYGVHSAMLTFLARAKCPQLVFVPARFPADAASILGKSLPG